MMAELPDRAAGEPHTTDATAARTSDTPARDAAPTGDAGQADANTAAHGASEHDAALLLDMKEPTAPVVDRPHELTATPVSAPAVRSILNAASDSSDGEDAAAVAARDDRGSQRRPIATKDNQAEDEEEDREEHEEQEEEEEDVLPPVHGEKGVEYTLSELFVNPNLRLKSANVVLKKDPFAIPRATDNVTEYRPRFNPLSILMSEEKLLPRNFTFDFSEGIPGEPKHQGGKTLGKRGKELQGRASRSNSDFDASSLLVRKSAPPPVRNPQVFGDKLSTMGLLMGSMPRQPQSSPKPLINTPTVHNPFGEPLLELVVNNDTPAAPSDSIAVQRLRAATAPSAHSAAHLYPEDPQHLTVQSPLEETLGAEFDAFGVDMHNISNLSKLSIAANNVAAADSSASFHGAAFATAVTSAPPPLTPPTPVLYDGLANYLPNHFAEKRVPHMIMDPSLYDVAAFHGEPDDHYLHQQQLHRHSGYEEGFGAASVAPASTPAHAEYNAHHHPQQHPQQQQQQQADSLQPVAKKPRSKNVFRPCTHPGCTKGARGKSGLCQKHGGGKRCATPNCPKGAQGSSKYCLFHGGGYRCTVPGCTTGARGTSGLCAKHGGYKRAREGGAGSGNDEAEDEMRGDGGPADKRPRMEAYEGRALEASG